MLELTDVYEIALLNVLGFECQQVVRKGSKLYFQFDDAAGPALNDSLKNDTQISARKYRHAIQDVRAQVFAQRRTSGEPYL